jgi:hypothetical protein
VEFLSSGSQTDPGRFEVMLSSLQPVEKAPSLNHELFISKL